MAGLSFVIRRVSAFVAFLCVSMAYPTVAPTVFDRDLKVTAVSRLILSKLGLTEAPSVTQGQLQSVDQKVLDAYTKVLDKNNRKAEVKASKLLEEKDEYYAKVVTVIDVTEWTGSPCSGTIASKVYQCDITKIPSAYTAIKRAVLQLYYDPASLTTNKIVLSAYQLTESCSQADRIFLDVQQLNSYQPAFVELDVTDAIKSWVTSSSAYHGLEVEMSTGTCTESSSSTLYMTFLQSGDNTVQKEYRPTLFITSQVINNKRRKRRQTLDLSYCSSLQSGQPNCCIYDFQVNFVEDLGWNWIIQPGTVSLNQCSGDCPWMWAEESNHTQTINEYKTLNPSGSVAPCCNPRSYDDLEIMYFDQVTSSLVTGVLTDMIVTSCVCS